MTVDIGDLLLEGFERTLAINGLLFAAIFFVLSVPSALLSAGMNSQMGMMNPQMGGPPSLGLPLGAVLALSLVVGLANLLVTVAAIRTFVTQETEEIRTEYFTRDILWVVANMFVGGIVFGVTVAIGLVFLIIPGLFLFVSLFFWQYYVVVENESFVEGFQSSWEATGGHRLKLFVLGFIVAIVGLIANLVFGLPALVLPDFAGILVSQAGSAITQVFALATASRTYVRLNASDDEPTSTASPREHAVE